MNEKLLEISKNINAQDNRCTSDPMFLIQEKRRDYGYDTQWSDDVVWLDEEGAEITPERDDFDSDLDFDNFKEDGWPEPQQFTETAYVDRWKTVTFCFTEVAADDYIDRNAHRHGGKDNMRTYVTSLYRNKEMIEIRNYLKNLTTSDPV